MLQGKNIVSVIDIGSNSIKGIVVQKKKDNQEIAVLSCAKVSSEGVKRGVVTDVELVSKKITELLSKLKREIKPYQIKEVFVNIGGPHLIAKLCHGAVAISRADQKVSLDDLDRVMEEAKSSISLTQNQEILDVFSQEYIVDNEPELKDVVGMKGIKLEARALAVCVFSFHLKRLVESVLGADIEITEIIPSPLASARALLTSQQKELGSAVVDIGAETTGIAIYEDKNLIHLAVLPIGSAHITRDIAVALQAEIDVAEEIKKKFGSYIFQNKNKKEKINIGKGEPFIFDTKKLIKAGKARIVEIFNLINKELKKVDCQGSLPAGVTLTGGGSKLSGIVDFAKQELKLPVRRGAMKTFIGIEEDPVFSLACGLVLYGDEEGGAGDSSLFSRAWLKVKGFFRAIMP